MKLKSKSGCLTCLARKKKCDEAVPKCGQCERLGIGCIQRGKQITAISHTNLGRCSPKVAISNGFPPFQSEFEKHVALESPSILGGLVSEMAASEYKAGVVMFGRFSTQCLMVREAMTAFAAYGGQSTCDDSYKVSLKSYQSCVAKLRQTGLKQRGDEDMTLTAIMFLGLLEGLKFGDPGNALAHFEMCRKLLASQMHCGTSVKDPALAILYRVAAECIIYNMASLTPFQADSGSVAHDWGQSFDCLFPIGSLGSSPFLGGFQEVYRIMFRLNMLLLRLRHDLANGVYSDIGREADVLLQDLVRLDQEVLQLYRPDPGESDTRRLYRAKYLITSCSLKVHLTKIREPSSEATHSFIRSNLASAIALLKHTNIYEPGNPALRWPLTILACAAEKDDDFRLLTAKMREVQAMVDPANSRKLAAASMALVHSRGEDCSWFPHVRQKSRCEHRPQLCTIEFLLDPRSLDEPKSGQ